jgi:hypothetical protein
LDLSEQKLAYDDFYNHQLTENVNHFLSILPKYVTELKLPIFYTVNPLWVDEIIIPQNITCLSCASVDTIQLYIPHLKTLQIAEQFSLNLPNLVFLHYLESNHDIVPKIKNLHTLIIENRACVFWSKYGIKPCLLTHLRIAAKDIMFISCTFPNLKTIEYYLQKVNQNTTEDTIRGDLISLLTGFYNKASIFTKGRFPALNRAVIGVDFDTIGKKHLLDADKNIFHIQIPDWITVEVRHAATADEKSLESIFYEQTTEQLKQIALSYRK